MHNKNVDESIVAKIQQAKTKSNLTIEKKVFINNTVYTFARRILWNNRVSMILPENFKEMPEEISIQKYPSIYRPQLILSSEDGLIDFAFRHSEDSLLPAQVQARTSESKKTIKNINRSNTFFEEGQLSENHSVVGHFDFRSQALDDDLYTFMFITDVDGHMMLGSFSCLFADRKDWNVLIKQMICTIEKNGAEEEAYHD